MKTSAVIVAALASTVLAAPPSYGGKGKHPAKWGKDYKFTSTYSITATPDQVANATADGAGFYYTGGLPVRPAQP